MFALNSGSDILLIFAKQPLPGQVKTRLCPPLTPTQAALFHACSLADTLEQVSRSRRFCPVLCYSGDAAYFQQHFPQLPRLPQGPGDLGARLTAAFAAMQALGAQRVCAIGSDSPDLPLVQIESAFDVLSESDFVTIPALDGGYVLIGSRREPSAAFAGIAWSSEKVLAQTVARVESAGFSCRQLAAWEDVDDEAALSRLARRPGALRAQRFARRCLRELAEI
ncbi:MAG: TIGR04282 family arsenosugar biosynthesis glycosyltransferase [Desulfuromonadaceae bacterium]|nr:TIGR04282 family arsenosugar biosynthesis glycosyltransferase [Desulfuromonadaceae bacterium]